MGVITVNAGKCNLCMECIQACPFGAIESGNEKIEINAACRVCKLCIKKCSKGAIAVIDEARAKVDKAGWKGVMVYVEHMDGEIHPVTYELVGKARELAAKIKQPVYCLLMGSGMEGTVQNLVHYGPDRVFVYDDPELRYYRSDIYANVFEDCINKVKPSIVLVGGTSIGRSLAPRVSTRLRTGLTADCTMLDVRDNSDLVQIRPAFGGNIMAQIITPNSRPQFATVRYKVMDEAERSPNASGIVERMSAGRDRLKSSIKVCKAAKKEKEPDITAADVLVVAGRGVREQKDLVMLEDLADALGGQLAVTRPLVECGWASYTRQIGLSGRTVKPKVIITCGVSGAIQFTACMNSSQNIIAINKAKNAPIFKLAHYGVVGDLYEVVPALMERIKEGSIHAI